MSARFSPADLGAYDDPPRMEDGERRGYWIDRHIDFMNRYALGVLDGSIKRLLVFGPPRHGKSEIFCRLLPTVFLGKNPDKRAILATYEADFAAQWGWKSRSLMQKHGAALWRVFIDPSSTAKDRWDIQGQHGGLATMGAGGAIMGKGADLLILDDLIKNLEAAQSETQRRHLWDWFVSTAMTRLEPGAAVIVMMHRWHEDDLAAQIQAKWPGVWTVLSMPALAKDGDQLGRAPGEPLWPERWPVESFAELRKDPETWNAEYQQEPVPEEGAMFRRPWFRYATRENGVYNLGGTIFQAANCRHFLTVDLACSEKTTADYTVVATGVRTPDGQYVVRDIRRKRLEGPDQLPEVEAAYRDVHDLWPTIHVESVQYQATLVQAARRKGLPAMEITRHRDKISRALQLQSLMKAGRVWFMQGAPWVQDLEHELMFFPNGKHDDQVDVLADGAHIVAEHVTPRVS